MHFDDLNPGSVLRVPMMSKSRISTWGDDVIATLENNTQSYEYGQFVCQLFRDLMAGSFPAGNDAPAGERIVGVSEFTLTPWRMLVDFECECNGKINIRQLTFGTDVVVLVPMTSSGELVLVQQYRLGIGRVWEIPRGMSKASDPFEESVRKTVKRELGIETEVTQLCFKDLSALSTGIAPYLRPHRYVQLRVDMAQVIPPSQDQAISQVRAFSSDQLKSAIRAGEIKDPYVLTAMALLSVQ